VQGRFATTFIVDRLRTTATAAAAAVLTMALFPGPSYALTRDPSTLAKKTDYVHMIVLVHGWLGDDGELSYFEERLQKEIEDAHPEFVVYSAKANIGKTADGIAAGGQRLADEIMDQLSAYHEKFDSEHFSLSFVGNSLGGLYARYALSKLDWTMVHPLIFCTTASPHLGVSNHTYFPIPRWAEWTAAQVIDRMKPRGEKIGSTGQDLFRYTDVLEVMAKEPEYIDPLANFQKRIAYANAFGTDFQVPTTTAAFLSKESNYPHETMETEESFFALKVRTLPGQTVDDESCLSQRLDQLGWTKVFCDVRGDIPVPSVPVPGRRPSVVPQQISWTSKELIPVVTSSGERFHLPLGHTVMVANSRNEIYSKINSQGRKVVDKMAADLIVDILALEEKLHQCSTLDEEEENDEPKDLEDNQKDDHCQIS